MQWQPCSAALLTGDWGLRWSCEECLCACVAGKPMCTHTLTQTDKHTHTHTIFSLETSINCAMLACQREREKMSSDCSIPTGASLTGTAISNDLRRSGSLNRSLYIFIGAGAVGVCTCETKERPFCCFQRTLCAKANQGLFVTLCKWPLHCLSDHCCIQRSILMTSPKTKCSQTHIALHSVSGLHPL